ncbi:tRNA (guanosine(37)-N1)-methyltransferase TrmD [Patescibacteria group bacterium]|nr:tRNA (guanosine(37)-N1)-methyltransferase TrmD [Patescibacteria group bacterium]
MKISIITLFPEVFEPTLNSSILKRAQKKGLVEFELINLRDFGEGLHKVVDDRPYGGGAGMILRADILAKAIRSLSSTNSKKQKTKNKNKKPYIILTSASGKPFRQNLAQKFSKLEHIIIVCGHYEGVDQRFADKFVSEEISIGDYILTGGEIPAMVIADSVTRLIPGVLKKPEATLNESFSTICNNSQLLRSNCSQNQKPISLLEHPQYTRPEEFEGEKVPGILLSGNHSEIEKWRIQESLEKTREIRPDLLNSNTKNR